MNLNRREAAPVKKLSINTPANVRTLTVPRLIAAFIITAALFAPTFSVSAALTVAPQQAVSTERLSELVENPSEDWSFLNSFTELGELTAWQAVEGVGSLSFSDYKNTGNRLYLRAAMHTDNDSSECRIGREFNRQADLLSSRYISFECRIDPPVDSAGETGEIRLSIVFYSGKNAMLYIADITPGEWCRVELDLGIWRERGGVEYIEINVGTGGGAAYEGVFYISEFRADMRYNSDMLRRFMSDQFTSSDCRLTIANAERLIVDFEQSNLSAPFVAAVMNHSLGGGMNVLRLVMENETDAKKVKIHYKYEDSGNRFAGFSEIAILPQSGVNVYYVPVEGLDRVTEIKIEFPQNITGSVSFSSIGTASRYTGAANEAGGVTSCEISADRKYIIVRGNVDYNTALKYKDYRLELRVADSLTGEIKSEAIAYMPMTYSFEFKIPVTRTPLTSAFAVAVCSPDGQSGGDYIYIDSLKYISNPEIMPQSGSAPQSLLNAFKGLQTPLISSAVNAGAGTVVIDLFSGLMADGFDCGYIDDIARRLEIYRGAGVRVYLRILVTGDPVSRNAFTLPEYSDEEYILSLINFITGKWAYPGNEYIAGLIVGTEADRGTSEVPLGEYAVNYSRIFRLVYTSAVLKNRDLRVYMPLSDSWDAEYLGEENMTSDYDKRLFLESVFRVLAEQGGIKLHLFQESSRNPAVQSDEGLREYISPGSIADLCEFAAELCAGIAEDMVSVESTAYFWRADVEQSGGELPAMYAYIYYSLFFGGYTDMFTVSFSGAYDDTPSHEISSQNALYSIKYLIKNIDTSKSLGASEASMRGFFGDNWKSLIANFNADKLAVSVLRETELIPDIPAGAGIYPYWDYSQPSESDLWQPGVGCGQLIRSYHSGGKSLTAYLNLNRSLPEEYNGVYCVFDYAEIFNPAQYLSFDLSIGSGTSDGGQTDGGEVYELIITAGGAGERVEGNYIIMPGGRTNVTLDIGMLSAKSGTPPLSGGKFFIRIQLRGIVTESESAVLRLYSVTGHSSHLNDEKFRGTIESLRRQAEGVEEIPAKVNTRAVAAAVVLVIISVIVFVALTKNDKNYN